MRAFLVILLLMVSILARSSAASDPDEVVLRSPNKRYTLHYLPIDGGNRVSNLRIIEAKSGKIVWRYKGDGETDPSFSWSPNGKRLAVSLRSVRWEYLTILELRDGAFMEVEVEFPHLPLKKDVPRESHERFNTAKCEAWTDNDTALLSFSGRCQLLDGDRTFSQEWVDYQYTGKLGFDPAQECAKFTLNPESSVKFFGDKVQQGGAGQPATRPELKSEDSDKPQPESEGRSR